MNKIWFVFVFLLLFAAKMKFTNERKDSLSMVSFSFHPFTIRIYVSFGQLSKRKLNSTLHLLRIHCFQAWLFIIRILPKMLSKNSTFVKVFGFEWQFKCDVISFHWNCIEKLILVRTSVSRWIYKLFIPCEDFVFMYVNKIAKYEKCASFESFWLQKLKPLVFHLIRTDSSPYGIVVIENIFKGRWTVRMEHEYNIKRAMTKRIHIQSNRQTSSAVLLFV